MKAVGKNAGILRCALNDTLLWPPCYPASEMMEGENVESFDHKLSPPPQPKAAHPLPILHRVLVLPKLSFDDFLRHQFQALIFVSFHQGKEKSPSAASRGKPAQRKAY